VAEFVCATADLDGLVALVSTEDFLDRIVALAFKFVHGNCTALRHSYARRYMLGKRGTLEKRIMDASPTGVQEAGGATSPSAASMQAPSRQQTWSISLARSGNIG
jgi:hypothetical protein